MRHGDKRVRGQLRSDVMCVVIKSHEVEPVSLLEPSMQPGVPGRLAIAQNPCRRVVNHIVYCIVHDVYTMFTFVSIHRSISCSRSWYNIKHRTAC